MGIKYSVNEHFFEEWTQEMSYILGFFFADGSMENAPYIRGKYIRITSTDKKIIQEIRQTINSEHTIVKTRSTHPNGRLRYLLRIGSHRLYNSLALLGLYPNKSKTMRFPNIPSKYFGDFLKGYFDGDGCVFLQTDKGKIKKLIIKKLSIIFTSGSEIFLETLAVKLKQKLSLKHDKIYKSNRAFQLRYSTRDSLRLFYFLYSKTQIRLFLERKLKIFGRYFKLQNNKEINPQQIFKRHKVLMATW